MDSFALEILESLTSQQVPVLIESQKEDVEIIFEYVMPKLKIPLQLFDVKQHMGLAAKLQDLPLQEAIALLFPDNEGILLIAGIDATMEASRLVPNHEGKSMRLRLYYLLHEIIAQYQNSLHICAVTSSPTTLDKRLSALFIRSIMLPLITIENFPSSLTLLFDDAWKVFQTNEAFLVYRSACIGHSLHHCYRLIITIQQFCLLRAYFPTLLAFEGSPRQRLDSQFPNIWTTIAKEDVARAIDNNHFLRTTQKTNNANVTPTLWADIGGLDIVREDILFALQLPLQYPEVFAKGTQGRGILLYGPPGTGKTLVAKAVATECKLAFLSVKGPELLDMYVGESERNLREVFAAARAVAPSILFFDELDSLAPARGKSGDAGGVMDRIVSQFLIEMDMIASSSTAQGVFVIGATNRPDLLDPALLRAGRFERKIFLGPCQSPEGKLSILKAQTRKFALAEGVELGVIADVLPMAVTGADIGAITSRAFSFALEEKLLRLEEEWQETSESVTSLASYVNNLDCSELAVLLTVQHFEQAVLTYSPSISAADAKHYESLRYQYESMTTILDHDTL